MRALWLGVWVSALGASGCATVTGALAAAGSLPSTSSREHYEPIGDVQRRVEVDVAVSPLRVVCRAEERAGRERVRHESSGFDTGGRLAYGFIGLGESALAVPLWYGAVQERSVGLGVLAGVLSLDAVATIVLAFALPNYHRVQVTEREGRWRYTQECPQPLAIAYEGRTLPVQPNGRLSTEDERWLLGAWVRGGQQAEVRAGARVVPWVATVEHRCAWAQSLAMPEAAALCATVSGTRGAVMGRPVVVSPTTVPTQGTFGLPPLRVVIELGPVAP
jgi:hypothetical protein